MKTFAYEGISKTSVFGNATLNKLIFVALCSMLVSCAARINGSLAADGSAALTVNISVQTAMSSLIQRLSVAGGQDGPVLNGPEIARSMTDAPGVSSVTLRNTNPSTIEGSIRISRVGDFLATANTGAVQRGFITFEQTASGGRCVISLNRNNGSAMMRFLSWEINDYLNALMAPIATGEAISKDEYLELVSSFYNVNISNEISSSRIRATIDFPGTITSVTGGTFSGRRATFDIPLLDILVLETPLVYEVRWR